MIVLAAGPGIGKLDDWCCDLAADPNARHRFGRGLGEEVTVSAAGGACTDRFSSGEPCPSCNEGFGDAFSFNGPNMVLQPFHQAVIVRVSSKQCHGGVTMAVH